MEIAYHSTLSALSLILSLITEAILINSYKVTTLKLFCLLTLENLIHQNKGIQRRVTSDVCVCACIFVNSFLCAQRCRIFFPKLSQLLQVALLNCILAFSLIFVAMTPALQKKLICVIQWSLRSNGKYSKAKVYYFNGKFIFLVSGQQSTSK